MKKSPYIHLILLLLLAVGACGKDNDSKSSATPPPVQEEDDNNGNQDRNTCLTAQQRRNITAVLDKVSGRDISGTFNRRSVEDGTSQSTSGPGTVSLEKPGQNSWSGGGGFCGGAPNPACLDMVWSAEFRSGCFFWGNERAAIRSTSANSFSVSARDQGLGTRLEESWRINSAGELRIRQTFFQNGQLQSTTTFSE
jgi:hypothetical protein